jgi:hypothetical protein
VFLAIIAQAILAGLLASAMAAIFAAALAAYESPVYQAARKILGDGPPRHPHR